MKYTTAILLLYMVLLCACNTEKMKMAEETTTTPEAKNIEVATIQEMFYLPTAIGNVPVYNSFEGIEPLFQQKNDTLYIINFWATWCAPCVEELPYFEKINEAYREQKVKVILVSLDFKRQLETKLQPFLEKMPLRSQVVVLTDNKYNNWINKVDANWGGAIPVTVIYKGEQRQFFSDQFSDFEELENVIKKLI